jgi:hypothetical protein
MAVVVFLLAMLFTARLFVARFFVARFFASDHDVPFARTPVLFDDHLSPGSIAGTVTSFLVSAAACYQQAGRDHTEHNDLSNQPASSHDELL